MMWRGHIVTADMLSPTLKGVVVKAAILEIYGPVCDSLRNNLAGCW